MPLIHKSEQTTLGNVFNLKDLDRKIYDDEEIKYFRMNDAINDHPLAKRPTSIRSKLAYSDILKLMKPTTKYLLPGQVVLFHYSEPKYKEELECYLRSHSNINIHSYEGIAQIVSSKDRIISIRETFTKFQEIS